MNKNYVFSNDLKRVFLANAPIGIIALLVNLVLTNGVAIAAKSGFLRSSFFESAIGEILFSFNGFNEKAKILLMVSLIMVPIILAWKMFGFVNSKKASDVYFSMGVSRKSLFSNRLIVATVMMLNAIVIPFIISIIWNVGTFGSSTALFQSAFFLIVRFISTSFAAFFLALIVISAVGTRAEEIAFIPILVALPTAVVYFLDMIRQFFFYGFLFSSGSYIANDYTSIKAKESFFYIADKFNIFPVLNREMVGGQMNSLSKGYEFPKEDYLSLIVLILFTTGLFFLARRAFAKMKLEKVGFFGSGSSVNIIVTGTVATVAVVLLGKLLSNGSNSGALMVGATSRALLCLATVVAVYLMLMPILTRNKKVFVKTMWKLPVFVAIFVIPALFVMTGGLGASNRVPEIGDVKCASISIPISAKGVLKDVVETNSHYIKLEGGQVSEYAGFTSEKDVSQIIKIHKAMIGIKKKAKRRERPYMEKMVIFYQLNDGSTIERTYDYVDKDVAEEWLKIVDSDFLKSAYIEAFFGTEKMSESPHSVYLAGNKEYNKNFKNLLNGKKAEIYNSIGKKTDFDLSIEQSNELRKAVSRDLENIPLSKIFFSEKQTLGTIKFTEQNCFGQSIVGKIFIVEEMKNTLEYLETFDFSLKQDNLTKPISAVVLELKNCNSKMFGSSSPMGSYLFSELEAYYDNGFEESLESEYNCKNVEFTDRKDLLKLQEISRKNQFTYSEGYAIVYKYADDMIRAEYIPENKMPDNLKPQ